MKIQLARGRNQDASPSTQSLLRIPFSGYGFDRVKPSRFGGRAEGVAPNAVKEAVAEIAARFEKETKHKLVLSWAGSEAISKRVSNVQPLRLS
jgi:hypothetical protein